MTLPRLHVEAAGDGPTVVLAHGFAGSARNFGPQARGLRDRFRVVRYDARGHARSEAPDDPAAYTPDTFADDLGRVFDGPAVVGGLSMGAASALHFALAHPERVHGLVLSAYPAGRDSGYGMSAHALQLADAIEQDGLEAAGARFVWGPESGLDATAARLVRQGFLEHTPHGLIHTLRGVLARLPTIDELAPRLRELEMPALVVVGERDQGSLVTCQRLVDELNHSTLHVIGDAGHVVNLHQPEAFNSVLREFLLGTAG